MKCFLQLQLKCSFRNGLYFILIASKETYLNLILTVDSVLQKPTIYYVNLLKGDRRLYVFGLNILRILQIYRIEKINSNLTCFNAKSRIKIYVVMCK